MQVVITKVRGDSAASRPLEIVERKGLGHPDTICDALVESLSRALSHVYLERFGAILHHNVDKALLVGGLARPAFGAGETVLPMEIHLAGRATRHFRGETIPVDDIAIATTRAWLHDNLRELPERDVRIHTHIRPTSPDLAELYLRHREHGAPLANDTSFGIGYAPLDVLERSVLAADVALHDPLAKAALPWVGDDTKVMGVRDGSELALTVACAFIGRHVPDLAAYVENKAVLVAHVRRGVEAEAGRPVSVTVNTADGAKADSVYLTVTGLSAEGGDDGQVGRGNRVNGLITPYRPMSLEAAAGKNPVSHVGKLYNVAAGIIARAVVAEVEGVDEAVCTLLSRIGQPIDAPYIAEVAVRSHDGRMSGAWRLRIDELVRAQLASIGDLWRDFVGGTHRLW